jgi:hypothetical protein
MNDLVSEIVVETQQRTLGTYVRPWFSVFLKGCAKVTIAFRVKVGIDAPLAIQRNLSYRDIFSDVIVARQLAVRFDVQIAKHPTVHRPYQSSNLARLLHLDRNRIGISLRSRHADPRSASAALRA